MPPPMTIREWLREIGMEEFAPDFEKNEITVDQLPSLTSDEIRELGVTSLGARKRLLAAIAEAAISESGGEVWATPVAALAVPDPSPKSGTVVPGLPPRPMVGSAPVVTDAPEAAVFPEPDVTPVMGPKPKRKGFSPGFLSISIGLHVILGLLATYWVVQTIQAERKLQFKAGPPNPSPNTRALEHKVSMKKKKNSGGAPAQPKRIAVAGMTASVTLPDMPTMPSMSGQIALGQMSGMGGAGFGQGLGFGNGAGSGMGGGTGMGGINFFGFRTSAKRIAFFLDYSGSMSGAFREVMEQELEKALTKLPPATEVLLISWAGPAWLHHQKAPEIMDKWRMIDNYDNFELLGGKKLDPPKWTPISSQNVKDIMKGVRAQVEAPGGTDWRQPFRYAMEASPHPDVIFFITDGQIPGNTTDRALKAIDLALRKGARMPQVNCLWIENRNFDGNELKELAKKYKGEYREVSAASASKD